MWEARASKVVHLRDGTHCRLSRRTWEAVNVEDVGTSGWDCKYWLMSTWASSLGVFLLYPRWVWVI